MRNKEFVDDIIDLETAIFVLRVLICYWDEIDAEEDDEGEEGEGEGEGEIGDDIGGRDGDNITDTDNFNGKVVASGEVDGKEHPAAEFSPVPPTTPAPSVKLQAPVSGSGRLGGGSSSKSSGSGKFKPLQLVRTDSGSHHIGWNIGRLPSEGEGNI